MNRKRPWLDWIAKSDGEIAVAWMEAWWLDARSHAPKDRVPRQMRREIEALHFAMIDLVMNEPVRALEVAFVVARTAEHPGMVAEIAAGVIQDLTTADPTLWDAVAVEAAANRRLLHAIGLVWGADPPHQLRDAFRRLAQPDDDTPSEARAFAGGRRGEDRPSGPPAGP